jgi:predicted nuclease of restriction endonuclease-like RecB superfamily
MTKNHCKAGWRTVGGQEVYFRSRWEANYARYLQWRLERGEIAKWEHEPETFWFEAIKRGCRSYLPDFRITRPDGTIYFVEVKGWMTQKSRTKLKRMAKYHPTVELELVERKQYEQIEKQFSKILPDWEK